ncbi:TolC family protein [bacterium]|nr:TolC family protein [bacterium]
MKRLFSAILLAFFSLMYVAPVYAITEDAKAKMAMAMKKAKPIELAFVFDGPSEKNAQVLQTFQKVITRSLLPDYKANFPKDLVFVGDWTEVGAQKVSDKALSSRARMVISLGYMSSKYYSNKKNKNKYVVTIDQYGLRDFGDKFFNPLQQMANDFVTFKTLVPNISKTAILMNENYYKTNKNWHSTISEKLKEKKSDLDFVVVPVNSNISQSLAKIPQDCDSVFVTPLYNLSSGQRQEIFQNLTSQKIPTFSSIGKEDVTLGAMFGTSTFDVDKKLAEATSFNIHGVLHGSAVKNEKIPFYDEKVIFYNSDTGEDVGYTPPLRLLNNAVTITNKKLPEYNLASLIETLDESNLDMIRKKYLVSAARRAVLGAYLRYLPTLRIDLGYQTYNSSYAKSYSDVPTNVGVFTLAMDQVLYSPDLVSNIILKHKKLKFDKAENALTKANVEYHTGNLYIDTLMLENMIKVQEESVQETRENLAIARVREKTGKCGYEEVFRWAGEVSEEEKRLLQMKADYKNAKIQISKLLNKDQKQDFQFAPLTANDPAFFTSDLHIIDHVRDPKKLGTFTDMLVDEVIYLSPETTKLKAALAMKKVEIGNYTQKFFLPNAMLSLEHQTQFGRSLPYENIGHNQMKYVGGALGYAQGAIASGGNPAIAAQGFQQGWSSSPYLSLDKNSTRLLLAAEWKPIEGGRKFAEIARAKAELNELKAYLEEVNTELELQVRSVVNRAISKYFMIEKSYKAMFAQAENYQSVKAKYLLGQVPINQLADAQHLYFSAKLDALNSQYEFFKELIWVQRGLLAVNWTKASDEAKAWINKIPEILPAEEDFSL